MNVLEATEKLNEINKRIEALDAAYQELWCDFENRWMAVVLNKIQAELEQERSVLSDKLRSIRI